MTHMDQMTIPKPLITIIWLIFIIYHNISSYGHVNRWWHGWVWNWFALGCHLLVRFWLLSWVNHSWFLSYLSLFSHSFAVSSVKICFSCFGHLPDQKFHHLEVFCDICCWGWGGTPYMSWKLKKTMNFYWRS
jgi:hypothetical protein